MSDMRRLRRAGGEALRLLVDLLPGEWDPRSGDTDVGIVFADIQGYSAFVAEHGDDAAVAVLRALDEAVAAALAGRRGSRVVKRLGDGLMVASKTAPDALHIGVGMIARFDDRAAAGGWPLRLRVGAHRGTTRRVADDYFGYHVNLAARVAESATGGQVLATANVLAGVDLDAEELEARPVGRLHGKGVAGAVPLFAVASGRHTPTLPADPGQRRCRR